MSDMHGDVQVDVEPELPDPEMSPLVPVLAPLVAIGATMLARKALNGAYSKVLGTPPPQINDARTPFGRAVLWTAVSAAAVAVIEVAVYRGVRAWGIRRAATKG